MASVCFYFQMHQPLRLRRYSVFDTDTGYFDDYRNAQVLDKVVTRSYQPTLTLLDKLVKKLDGRFRFSLSITGVLADQLLSAAPQIIERIRELVDTGCVELLNETYFHSLAFLYSRAEFREQIELHAEQMEQLFGQRPQVFRNTELIYNNDLAYYIESLDCFRGILAEGADRVLGSRDPCCIYTPPHTERLKLLLKHYRLSDDIAFRFSNRNWSEWPLTAEKYAGWLSQLNGESQVCNLFLDLETFGEHQWAETGIFDFLESLPGRVLQISGGEMLTCSQALERYDPVDEFDAPHMISWADSERDLSAWLGNAMQSNAMHELYKLEAPIRETGDEELLADWRKLTTSDHVYYMCTKYFADGDVHKYFNPYESPYDSYINFMNVLDNLRSRVAGAG